MNRQTWQMKVAVRQGIIPWKKKTITKVRVIRALRKQIRGLREEASKGIGYSGRDVRIVKFTDSLLVMLI